MKTKFQLTASGLKIIAMVTMLIDHLTALLYPGIYEALTGAALTDPYSSPLYAIGRALGRTAYPLFAFMISEGARYSHDRKKYALRLLAIAVISIPFYNLAVFGAFWKFDELNTIFGLFVGLIAILWIDQIDADAEKAGQERSSGRILYKVAVLLLLSVLCTVCKVEYYSTSVLMIPAFYYAKDKKQQLALGALAFIFGSFQFLFCYHLFFAGAGETAAQSALAACRTMRIQLWGLLALLPIWFYNGSKGMKLPRYLFYAFYPAHLLVLGLIALAMQA